MRGARGHGGNSSLEKRCAALAMMAFCVNVRVRVLQVCSILFTFVLSGVLCFNFILLYVLRVKFLLVSLTPHYSMKAIFTHCK